MNEWDKHTDNFKKIEGALKTIHDGSSIDSGGGLGSRDYWVKIGGVEYFVQVQPTTPATSMH